MIMNQSRIPLNRSAGGERREKWNVSPPQRLLPLAAALALLLAFFLAFLPVGWLSEEGRYGGLVVAAEAPGNISFTGFAHATNLIQAGESPGMTLTQLTSAEAQHEPDGTFTGNFPRPRSISYSLAGVRAYYPPDENIPEWVQGSGSYSGAYYGSASRHYTGYIVSDEITLSFSFSGAMCESLNFRSGDYVKDIGCYEWESDARSGSFTFPAPPAGRAVSFSLRLFASNPGGSTSITVSGTFTAPPEEPPATAEPTPTTEVSEEERPITVEGTVTIPDPERYGASLHLGLLGAAATGIGADTVPLPDVVVLLEQADNVLARTFTDIDGRFIFRDVSPAEDLTISVVLQHAIHAPNDPPYFQIVYNQQSQPIRISTQPFTIDEETADPLVKEIRLHEPAELTASPADLQPDQYVNAGITYYYIRQGWYMAALRLGQPLDFAPLNVRIYSSLPFWPNAGAYWVGPWENKDEQLGSDIAPAIELDPAYSNYRWHNRRDVVLHEFGHHLTADSHGNFFPANVGDINHGGFANPSTTDSWVEGFATFFAAWTARDVLNLPDAHLWRDGAAVYNLEVNRLAWSESFGEEFAVASLLWDLLDPIDPSDCTYLPVVGYASYPVITATTTTAYCDYVQIDSNELWEILSGARPFGQFSSSPNAPDWYPYIFDMRDLYRALKGHYSAYAIEHGLPLTTPNGLDPIDELFIAHGFFADISPQNLAYDLGEEIGFTSHMTLTIGADSFPLRPRRSPPPTPNSYIGYELYDTAAGTILPPAPSDYFLVEVLFDAPYEHYNYSYETHSGEAGRLLYIGPPAHYPARTHITALAPDYIPVGELEFTNEFYWRRMAEQPADTFLAHTFVFEAAYGYGMDQTLPRLLLALIGLMSMCGCLTLLVGAAAVIFWRSRQK